MGYRVGGGGPIRRKTQCGWLWWKQTCCWIEGEEMRGSYEEWFNDYPLGEYPTRKFTCTTCGKVEWR